MIAKILITKKEITLEVISGKNSKIIKLNPVQLVEILKGFKRDFRHDYRDERVYICEKFVTCEFLRKLRK